MSLGQPLASQPLGSAEPSTDAFISYSRVDVEFAAKLERSLEDHPLPPELKRGRKRLDVFRDQQDFTGVEYYESIERHLGEARKLIVVCSPEAKTSRFVDDEIRRFTKLRGASNIVPVLWRGLPTGAAEPGAAFPAALCEALAPMPLAIDFRALDVRRHRPNARRFSDSWYGLLANVLDLGRAEIEQRAQRRRRRVLQLVAGVSAGIAAILSVFLVIALQSRQTAIRERNVAEERRRQALARQLITTSMAIADSDYPQSLLLAVEAARVSAEVPALGHLQELVNRHRSFKRVVRRHQGEVIGLHWHPGHGLLTSVDDQGTVISAPLDAAPARERRLAVKKPTAAAVSPDGNLVAFGVGRAVQLWSLNSEDLPWILNGHTSSVSALAFSPDGRWLVSGGWDSTAIVWNLQQGRIQHGPLRGHTEATGLSLAKGVLAATFNSAATRLATTGGDNTGILWDPGASKPLLAKLKGHGVREGQLFPGVRALAISPDDSMVVTGGDDRELRFWDAGSGKALGDPLPGHDAPVRALAFLAAGEGLISGDLFGKIRVWSVANRKPMMILEGNDSPITKLLAVEPHTFVSGDESGRVIEWQLSEKRDRMAINLYHPGFDAQPRYEPATGNRQFPDILRSVVFSPSGRRIAAGSDDGNVVVWEIPQGNEIARFRCQPAQVFALRFSFDEALIACAGLGPEVGTRDLASKQERRFRTGRPAGALDFTASGDRLAVGLAGGEVEVFGVHDARAIWKVSLGRSPAALVRFVDSGRRLFAADHTGQAGVLDSSSGKILNTVNIGASRSAPFGLSVDGEIAAFAEEATVHFWDIARWRELHSVPILSTGSGSGQTPVDLRGKLVAVTDNSKTSVFDTVTGEQLWPALGGVGSVNAVALDGDAKRLALVGASGWVQIWDLDRASWERVACQVAGRSLSREEWGKHLSSQAYRPACAAGGQPATR